MPKSSSTPCLERKLHPSITGVDRLLTTMKLWDVSRPFRATCAVVVPVGERLLPSALTSVTDINGRTSSGRI